MAIFGRKDCVGAPPQPLGFATVQNLWDLVECLEITDQSSLVLVLSQSQSLIVKLTLFSEHFLKFLSCELMVQSSHFLCNVFHVYLVWDLAFTIGL